MYEIGIGSYGLSFATLRIFCSKEANGRRLVIHEWVNCIFDGIFLASFLSYACCIFPAEAQRKQLYSFGVSRRHFGLFTHARLFMDEASGMAAARARSSVRPSASMVPPPPSASASVRPLGQRGGKTAEDERRTS